MLTGLNVRLIRAFVDVPLAMGSRIGLPDDATTHLVRVLRLEAGDACTLFNGDGCNYEGRIVSVSKRETLVEILAANAVGNESPLRITLLQGIARGEKMDLIVQKATELGVHAIVPVISERSEVKLDAQRAQKRHAHWRSVAIAACEQSGRTRIPLLQAPQSLPVAAVGMPSHAVKLTLDPDGQHSVANLVIDSANELVIAIGPEGGWSPRDRQVLQAAGYIGLRLGPRILRTETAGLAAIAALQSRFGDLR